MEPQTAVTTCQQSKKKRKPYMCAFCSKAFSKAISLQSHMTNLHGYREESEEEDETEEESHSETISGGTSLLDSSSNGAVTIIQPSLAASMNSDVDTETSKGEYRHLLGTHVHDDMNVQCNNFSLNSNDGKSKESRTHTREPALIANVERNQVAAPSHTELQVSGDIVAQAASAANIVDQICGSGGNDENVFRMQVDSLSYRQSAKGAAVQTVVSPHESGKGQDGQTNSSSSGEQQHGLSSGVASQDDQQCKNEPSIPITSIKTASASNTPSLNPKCVSARPPSTVKYFGCGICHHKFPDLAACTQHMEKRHGKVVQSASSVLQKKPIPKPRISAKVTHVDERGRKNKTFKQKILALQRANEETRQLGQEVHLLIDTCRAPHINFEKEINKSLRETSTRRNKSKRRKRHAADDVGDSETLPETSPISRRAGLRSASQKPSARQSSRQSTMKSRRNQRTRSKVKGQHREDNMSEKSLRSEEKSAEQLPVQETTCTSTSIETPTMHTLTFACSVCELKFVELQSCITHLEEAHATGSRGKLLVSRDFVEEVSANKSNERRDGIQWIDVQDGVIVSLPDKPPEKRQHACKFCEAVFKTDVRLRAHMSQHCGRFDVKCNKCDVFASQPTSKAFEKMALRVQQIRDLTDSSDFTQQRGKRLGVQYFQCVACNDHFAVERHLKEHLKTHDSIVCQFCDESFSTMHALSRHIPSHNKGPLVCRTCKKTFFSTYMLLLHMRGHTGNYKCTQCDATFMFQPNLLRHVKKQHSVNQQAHSERVSTEDDHTYTLPLEKEQRTLARELKFKCNICGSLHRKESTLKMHIDKYHAHTVKNPGRFVCEVCGAVRRKLRQLKNHMICHREPTHKCPHCDKVFVRLLSLKTHVAQIHEGKRGYQCKYCAKEIASLASLLDHERLHTGEKPYYCDICGESFRLNQSYKNHKAIEHLQGDSHVCVHCEKTFATRPLLHKHLKTHNPQESCPCNVCGRTFTRRDLLKKHQVIHRQAIRCKKCGRRFSTDIALRYHMNKIHKVDTYQNNKSLVSPAQSSSLPIQDGLACNRTHAAAELFSGFSPPGGRDPVLPLHLVGSSSGVDQSAVNLSMGDTLPASACTSLDAADIAFDERFSDPTKLAISVFLSELCADRS